MKIILTSSHLKALSSILADIGQVVLATFVLTPFVSGVDVEKRFMILSGLVVALFFWSLSVALAEEGKL